jgi:hydrogenase-4 component B
MAFLAFVCLALGVLPTYVIPVIDKAVMPITHVSGADVLVPPLFYDNNASQQTRLPKQFVADFHNLGAQIGRGAVPGRGLAVIHRGGKKNPVVFVMSTSYMFVTLIFMLVTSAILVHFIAGRFRKVKYRPRWDGGVRYLSPEMTYTATGFAQPVRVIFEAILATKTVDRQKTIAEHFRMAISRKRREIHLTDRLILRPFASAATWTANTLARIHGGKINTYAGYMLFVLILFLFIAMTAS